MKKLIALSLVALSVLSSFALLGCANDGKTKIRLCEVTHSVFYAPVYVAINNGYFDEYDIKIELTNGGGADKVMTAVASKSADIGLMGPEATIYCQAQGQRDYPIIFGQLTQKDGSFLVSKTPNPDFEWTDLAGKHILAGRLGGVPAMTMQYIVNQAGLNHETDLNFNTTVAFNMMAPVFESDASVDYTTLFEPTASEMVAQGKGYIVASVGQASGEIPYTSFSASQSYLQNNEDIVKNFLRAILKAIEFTYENDAMTVAQALAPSFSGTSIESLASAVISYRNIDAWKRDLIFTETGYAKLQDVMQNAGFLESRVTFADAVDNSLVQEISAEND